MSLFDDLPPPPIPAARPTPAPPPAKPAGPKIHTVSEILAGVKRVLDDAWPEVWVRGEISEYRRYDSGHVYFKLRDQDGVLSAVLFAGQQRFLRFRPQDGMEVEARGVFDVYPARGALQLRVLEMRPAGLGALLVAFEELKKRLATEGLFDAARKRPLPRFPNAIGLITSPQGAAIRDLLHVLRRRWPGLRLVLAPVPVQGPGAASQIAEAIARMNALGGLDVLVVGRGGGSLEDLWAFNEEVLVRAIAGSPIPVVSAVGHEVDVTLADLAADVRAATPSAAAELLTTPTRAEILGGVRRLSLRVAEAMDARLGDLRARLDRARGRYGFRRADDLVAALGQELDEWRERLRRAMIATLRSARGDVRAYAGRLRAGRLLERVRHHGKARVALRTRLALACQAGQARRVQRVAGAKARLFALSPLAVLHRGYSLVTLPDGTVVRAASQLGPGAAVALRFASGRAGATITSTTEEP
jgi:exodeoxyribonuclease VII large subunit